MVQPASEEDYYFASTSSDDPCRTQEFSHPENASLTASPLSLYAEDHSRRCMSAPPSHQVQESSLHPYHSHGGPSSESTIHSKRSTTKEGTPRARLTDRAAHIEKHRLRAARTRNLSISFGEEKYMALQGSRGRKADDMKSKDDWELRCVERRPSDPLRIPPKGSHIDKKWLLLQQRMQRRQAASFAYARKEKELAGCQNHSNRVRAAGVIQRAWRRHLARHNVNRFRQYGLVPEVLKEKQFDEVSDLLSQEELIRVTSLNLRLLGLLDCETGSLEERGTVRTFLATYMIVSHPSDVLNGNGDHEEDLIETARNLVSRFDNAIDRLPSLLSAMPHSSELQTLLECYNSFFAAFHAWKSHDSSVLIEIMLAQFVELELIWQTVKDDTAGGVAEDYRSGIRQNQIQLLARLKRLAGRDEALEKVKHALKKATRPQKKAASKEEAVPRAVPESPPQHAFLNDESSIAYNGRSPLQVETKAVEPNELAHALTALPDNRVLVHELMIDREYRVDEASYIEPRSEIVNVLCKLMREAVAEGRGNEWTEMLATILRDKLLRLLQPEKPLHIQVKEALDPRHIRQQCEAGVFSYDAFFSYMGTILPRICAPYRDPDVRKFVQEPEADHITRFGELMKIVDLLCLDHVNFMLHVASPQLIQEGPGYESRAFARDLESRLISTQRTEAFWERSKRLLVHEMSKRDPDQVNGQPQPSAAKTYVQGLVDLVLCNRDFCDEDVPETLDLDRKRLKEMHAMITRIAATASILLSAKNMLKRDVRSQWTAEAERIMSLCHEEAVPERVQSIIESSHPMPAGTRQQLLSTVKKVLYPEKLASPNTSLQGVPEVLSSLSTSSTSSSSTSQTRKRSRFSDPVTRLVLSRLRAHVLTRLNASSAKERVRVVSTASQSLAGAGLPEFVTEVGRIVDLLSKIRETDWLCHDFVYQHVSSKSQNSGVETP